MQHFKPHIFKRKNCGFDPSLDLQEATGLLFQCHGHNCQLVPLITHRTLLFHTKLISPLRKFIAHSVKSHLVEIPAAWWQSSTCTLCWDQNEDYSQPLTTDNAQKKQITLPQHSNISGSWWWPCPTWDHPIAMCMKQHCGNFLCLQQSLNVWLEHLFVWVVFGVSETITLPVLGLDLQQPPQTICASVIGSNLHTHKSQHCKHVFGTQGQNTELIETAANVAFHHWQNRWAILLSWLTLPNAGKDFAVLFLWILCFVMKNNNSVNKSWVWFYRKKHQKYAKRINHIYDRQSKAKPVPKLLFTCAFNFCTSWVMICASLLLPDGDVCVWN